MRPFEASGFWSILTVTALIEQKKETGRQIPTRLIMRLVSGQVANGH